MMAMLVETSSRACPRDVVEAQAAVISRRLPEWPAHVIAKLVDAGKAVGSAPSEMFVGCLHDAETHIGLEAIGSEAALGAISEHVVVEQGKDLAAHLH